jgi:hypothetical protein
MKYSLFISLFLMALLQLSTASMVHAHQQQGENDVEAGSSTSVLGSVSRFLHEAVEETENYLYPRHSRRQRRTQGAFVSNLMGMTGTGGGMGVVYGNMGGGVMAGGGGVMSGGGGVMSGGGGVMVGMGLMMRE